MNIYSEDAIAIHVNPRPNEGLVLNTWVGGWGPEERPPGFPFKRGVEVTLTVVAGPEGFDIQATTPSGRPFSYHYKYRLPQSCEMDRMRIDLADVTALSIQPEVEVPSRRKPLE